MAIPYVTCIRDTVERDLEMMLKEGVIQPCVSDWASPMVIIVKRNVYFQVDSAFIASISIFFSLFTLI